MQCVLVCYVCNMVEAAVLTASMQRKAAVITASMRRKVTEGFNAFFLCYHPPLFFISTVLLMLVVQAHGPLAASTTVFSAEELLSRVHSASIEMR